MLVSNWCRLDTCHTLEELLFQFCLCDLNLHGFVNLLSMSALVVGIVLDGGREESVDEGSLSKSRFASNLQKSIPNTKESGSL